MAQLVVSRVGVRGVTPGGSPLPGESRRPLGLFKEGRSQQPECDAHAQTALRLDLELSDTY